jgi:hypothetical protein
VSPVVLGGVLLAALLVWLLRPRRNVDRDWGVEELPEPPDTDELEAAEREVRDLDVTQRPEDGFEGDDWGPGAGKR